jgi:ABC-type polysaccharide/polyol phosphate transport system ATPase subunit
MVDLSLNHVSKRYSISDDNHNPPRKRPAFNFLRRKSRDTWALRDVSFQVEEGESLGIIGNNGAGKSTILKLLSRITSPTSGEIQIRGRLAALVEVSSGFHPELSGRENIYLNGSMLGMTRTEMTRRIESIIDFAGVWDYIDVPVKRYSSGMYVRLGFSIAAHLDPDILLLDEVLAVGDLIFQARCLDLISQLRKSGRTIVLISHDLAAIQRLCDRALLMHQGQVAMSGAPSQVIERYEQLAMSAEEPCHIDPEAHTKAAQCMEVAFTAERPAELVRTGYPMTARFGFRARKAIEDVVFNILIYWPSGYLCAQLTTSLSDLHLLVKPGSGTIEFHCPELEIQPGSYRVDLSIESNGVCIDSQERCAVLRVHPGKAVLGDFYINASSRMLPQPTTL